MKKEFVDEIKDFVNKVIEYGSEYLWLTNFKNYGTMFKTIQNAEQTAINIANLLVDNFGDTILNIKKELDEDEDVLVVTTEVGEFRLFDYTQGVIESI